VLLWLMLGVEVCNKESVEAFARGKDKSISALALVNSELVFEFSDGYKMKLFDDGQSCCESRYMMTDDNLSDFIGSTLLDAEVLSAPNEPDEYGEHEVQFLVIRTDRGAFTMATHNEHNGYYGGFSVIAKLIE